MKLIFLEIFALSGHVFLLVYICLLNAEEASVFRNWYRIRQIVDENLAAAENADLQPSVSLANLSRDQLITIRRDFELYVCRIEWNFVLITALNLVWDVCFLVTVFYYHTAAQKFLAFGLAVFSWFITYRLWYKCENASPGLPGHSVIKYNERPDLLTIKK
uniref:Uncharacterized protein n=1 Tax=Romanomermis culicivorax TaxID=13658 RepID=A0A915K2I1_ROMCU